MTTGPAARRAQSHRRATRFRQPRRSRRDLHVFRHAGVKTRQIEILERSEIARARGGSPTNRIIGVCPCAAT